MRYLIKLLVKKILAFYILHFPIKINKYWFYMSPNNIELVVPMLLGNYEIGMTKLLKTIVKKGWVICDVGSYIGYHANLFSRLTGKGSKVICVEPAKRHFRLLLKNIKLNNLDNVDAKNMAILNKKGSGYIYIPDTNSPDSRVYKVAGEKRSTHKVKVETLDNLLKFEDRVDLIKMDIQGSEEKAIMGAKKTLEENPNILLIIEFWPKGLMKAGTKPIKLLETIKEYGFKIYIIDEKTGELKRTNNLDSLVKITNHSDGGFIDLLCSRKFSVRQILKYSQ